MSDNQEKHALIAFGGNQNFGGITPEAAIPAAIIALAAEGLRVLRCSSLYRTPCFPPGSGPDYVNAAAVMTLRHPMPPEEILLCLHRVEAVFGRKRGKRWAARTLDIDLLALGDSIIPDAATQTRWRNLPLERQMEEMPEGLILPHPRMADRGFVLVPLAEVAAGWRHPVTGLSVAQMLAALPEAARNEVVMLAPPPQPIRTPHSDPGASL